MEKLRTHEDILDLSQTGRDHLESLTHLLFDVDLAIVEAEKTLNRLQPPYEGKLDVSWFKKRGRTEPRVVRWVRHGKLGWRTEKVSVDRLALRAKQKDGFERHHKEVTLVLEELAYLLKTRGTILRSISNLKRAAIQLNRQHGDRIEATVNKLLSL